MKISRPRGAPGGGEAAEAKMDVLLNRGNFSENDGKGSAGAGSDPPCRKISLGDSSHQSRGL